MSPPIRISAYAPHFHLVLGLMHPWFFSKAKHFTWPWPFPTLPFQVFPSTIIPFCSCLINFIPQYWIILSSKQTHLNIIICPRVLFLLPFIAKNSFLSDPLHLLNPLYLCHDMKTPLFNQGHQWCTTLASSQWPSLGPPLPWPLCQQHWTLLTTLFWSNLLSASLRPQAPESSFTSMVPPLPDDFSSPPTHSKVISSRFWLQMATYMLMTDFKVIIFFRSELSSELQAISFRTSTTDLTKLLIPPSPTPHKKPWYVHKPSQEKVLQSTQLLTSKSQVIFNFFPFSLMMNLSEVPGFTPSKTDLHSIISQYPYHWSPHQHHHQALNYSPSLPPCSTLCPPPSTQGFPSEV